jgi:hypothetical protein
LFNPSFEIQTTDNYLDWTSLSVVYLTGLNFSSRQIPSGTESEIDICSMTFEMPIYITAPAKVKKLGVVKTIINNVFGEDGSVADLGTLIYNQNESMTQGLNITIDNHKVFLIKGPEGTGPYDYYLTFTRPADGDDWRRVLDLHGGYTTTSLIHFLQPTGYEVTGTFEVNPIDPTILVVTLDSDTVPTNTLNAIDRIVDPYNFNPIVFFGGQENIPAGTRYLIVDNILVRENFNYKGNWMTSTVYYIDDVVYYKNQNYICTERHVSSDSVGLGLEADSSKWNIIRNPSIPETAPDSTAIDNMAVSRVGSDAWQNFDSAYAAIKANSIIEWTGEYWAVDFDPDLNDSSIQYMQNLKTGIQYTWDGDQWLKSFEGEYGVGYWRLELDA